MRHSTEDTRDMDCETHTKRRLLAMHLLACEHQIAVDVELWQEPLGLMREVKDVSGRGVGPFVPVGQSVAEVERLLEY